MRWVIFLALCAAFAASGYVVLRQAWTTGNALRWLILATLVLTYQAVVLGRNLDKNYRDGEMELLPGLGLGNSMTLLRGVLVAGLVGFLFSPHPQGWLVWVPGILYSLAAAADFLDGYLARLTHHATRLGEILDLSFDGLGVLAAALLAVQYGQVPVWYLSVALARYVFLAGMWLRKITGRPNYELPSSISRRLFAGLQMGFLGVILWPVFSPPGSTFAASLFALPFLIGFGRDWLFVSGVFKPTGKMTPKTTLYQWGLPAFRLAAAGLASYIIISRLSAASTARIPLPFTIMELAVAVLILLGITGRILAVAGLILIGLSQQFASLAPAQYLLASIYVTLLFAGTGPFSLWAPEDRAVYGRLGEAQLGKTRLGKTPATIHPGERPMIPFSFGKPRLKLRHLLWFGLAVLFAWGLRSIPLASIWQALLGLSLPAVMALILINIGLFLLFSSRWWLILWAQGYEVPFLALVSYRLAGFSMSYFTPGPQFGGEPLQIYLTRKHHDLPESVAVAAVSLDKLLEVLVNFTFLVTGIAITIQTGLLGELAIARVFGLAVALLSLPAGYLLALWAGWQPISRLGKRLPWLAGKPMMDIVADSETQAARFCRRRPDVILAALILSLVVWAGMILEYWLMLHFLGLPLNLAQTITALTAARLAFLAPTPGGLGALEASQAFAMQALGFSPALGISATLLIRARDLIIGGLGLWWLGMLTRGQSPVPVPVSARDRIN